MFHMTILTHMIGTHLCDELTVQGAYRFKINMYYEHKYYYYESKLISSIIFAGKKIGGRF